MVYVNSSPESGGSIFPSSQNGFVVLTVGTLLDSIDLSTVKLYIDDLLIFDGSDPVFVGDYSSLSTYQVSVPDNGYIFNVKKSPNFSLLNMVVAVEAAGTIDPTVQQFEIPISLCAALPSDAAPPIDPSIPVGGVGISAFSGESSQHPMIGDSSGLLFISPSLNDQSNSGSDISLNSLEFTTNVCDEYIPQDKPNSRVFLFGFVAKPARTWPPNISVGYAPKINSSFRFLPGKKASVRGYLGTDPIILL